MARKVNFYDNAESSTTPTIGNIEASNLIQYANDAAYESGETGSPTEGNIYFNTTDKTIRYYDGTQWRQVARNVDVVANADDIADIRTTTGTTDGDTNMGTYTGSLINDNESTKQNIQQLETAIENNDIDIAENVSDIADIRTTTGTADGDTDMGTYTGGILTDNQNVKQNIQELSDAVESIPAGLAFQGNWNADTNTPTLVSSTGTAGHYYNVSVAGTTSLDGEADWNPGDWAVFNDTGVWQKIDNSDNVTSVNSQTGAVVLDTDDISEGSNLYYTEGRVTANASVTANTAKVSADGSIDTHSDVDTTSVAPNIGEALAWDGSNWVPTVVAGGSSTPPTIQKFTSGSGTYTTPASVLYIKVTMVGGGGGSSGSGIGGAANGTAGGNTTFGTTLLVANGGGGGVFAASPLAGGTASLGTGPIGIALQGAFGQGGGGAGTGASAVMGGSGGATPFGGGGAGWGVGTAATGQANTGAGAGGGGSQPVANSVSGCGGSAGGYVLAIITSPLASYSYAVGAAGGGGAAGTSGVNGAAGGSGVIIVEEYY